MTLVKITTICSKTIRRHLLRATRYSTTSNHAVDEKHSLCGKPLIRSPFDNPNRTILFVNGRPTARETGKSNNSLQQQQPSPSLVKEKEKQQQMPTEDDLNLNVVDSGRPELAAAAAAAATSGPASLGYERISANEDGQNEDLEAKAQEKERRERQEWQWKNVKIGIAVLSAMVGAGIIYVVIVYGRAPKDPVTGQVIKDQYSDMTFALFWRVCDFFTFWKTFIAEPSRDKLLPDPVKPPWHQPKYTVVLEMRNVLVNPEWNYKKGHYFVKRPALDYFMDVVGYPNFELVIYTSENMTIAAPVVAQIDVKGHRLNHVLFRDCTKYRNGAHIKDLSRLNRDLSKVIYIDWEPAAFQMNPDNVLRVPKWQGDMDDTFLVDLAELLKTIHISDVDDVRPVLQFYSQFDNPMAEFRRRAKMLSEDAASRHLDAASPSAGPSSQDNLKKYRGSLFGARRHAI